MLKLVESYLSPSPQSPVWWFVLGTNLGSPHSVHLQLAKDEATISLDKSMELPLHSDITLSILISTGIDLEEQQ